MKFTPREPPRPFEVGHGARIRLSDCGRVDLAPDEQVTFHTESGAEYDVTRKAWGFYATPSLNGRLPQFRLHGVLVKSPADRYYVFLVEEGKEEGFETYLRLEGHSVVAWLDTNEALGRLEGHAAVPGARPCPCGGSRYRSVHVFDRPPEGEIAFKFAREGAYRRELLRCEACGHFVSTHPVEAGALYAGDYTRSNYGDQEGIRRAFEKITALPAGSSDNAGRVRRILEFARARFPEDRFRGRRPTVLDVGSGLCVFLHRMKAEGWDGTAVDPDADSVRHASEHVGVRAIHGDVLAVKDLGRFDLVTLNRVLEHVPDPRQMLARTAAFVLPGGVVYVEVPDGEQAIGEGPGREEFFIDHIHVFSAASLALLAAGAGLSVLVIERLREPSGKFTLRAFLEPRGEVRP